MNLPPASARTARARAPAATATVWGGGLVGTCCALALQARGWQVTVVEATASQVQTSGGNAGVLSRSSLIPLNTPALRRQLPAMLWRSLWGGRRGGGALQVHWGSLLAQPGWGLRFLMNTRERRLRHTAQGLDALIVASQAQHRQWMGEAGVAHRLREEGWWFAYRSADALAASEWARALYRDFGVAHEVLEGEAWRAHEPAAREVLTHAVWMRDAFSVNDPQAVLEAYRGMFRSRGGHWVDARVDRIERRGSHWITRLATGTQLIGEHAVLALGPWSRDLLREQLGVRVRMAFERGHHRHFTGGALALRRPVYDAAAGYVLSPMGGSGMGDSNSHPNSGHGLRLTTGVHLAEMDVPVQWGILDAAETAAREAFDIGDPVEGSDWWGSRPTLPDSRPVIGRCPGHDGLWLAFGHQHIGFSTSAGTGVMLAALMQGESPETGPAFDPARCVRG